MLPIGRLYKLRESPPSPAVPNELLEAAFTRNSRRLPSHTEIVVSIIQGRNQDFTLGGHRS